jgi:iron complex outermembrane receptor protein
MSLQHLPFFRLNRIARMTRGAVSGLQQFTPAVAVAAMFGGLAPPLALAAEEETGGAPALEEIVVTATRREASAQDVAVPVTAVSGEALERAFAQDLRDLTAAAPNVQLEPVGIFQNSASFFIRGQGTGDIESAADSKVTIFVDDVVQARVSTALSDFVDISLVEILRGPQGTLFGRNTIAGAVQVRHNAPELKEWGVSASAQVGDFGRRDLKLVANLPINDMTAARLAVKDTQHDGYWKNTHNGKDRGGTDRITLLPSLRIQPTEGLDIVLRGEYNKTRDDTYMTQAHHYCRSNPRNLFLGLPVDNDLVVTTQTLFNLIVRGQAPFTAADNAAQICAKPFGSVSVDEEYSANDSEDRGQGANLEIWGLTAQVTQDIGDIGTLTYVGNYREVNEDIIFTIDVAPHDLFAGRRIQDHYQTSHEVRFASDFSEKFDFVAGAYYFEQEYAMKQESFGILFAPNIIFGPSPLPTFTSPVTQGQAGFSNQDNSAWAVFTQANWHVTDDLTITVGGRYTSELKAFKHCAVGSGDPTRSVKLKTGACQNVPAFVVDLTRPPVPGTPTPLFQLTPAIGRDASGGVTGGCRPVLDPTGTAIRCNNRLKDSERWTDFTPMAGVTYQITDDVMAYFTYTEGFTAGGFNGRGGSISTIGPFEPEKADNFEIGMKSEWFDRRLRANLTAFMTDVKDFQTAFIRPAPGGGGQETIQSNLGALETEGIELELSAVPVEGLTLWFNTSHLKTKRKGFCTDPDGPSGTNPNVPPTEGGPFSQGLPVCGTPVRINDAIGNFVGWLVPNDLADLNPTGRSPKWTYAAGFAWELPWTQAGTFTLNGDWLHQGKQTIAGSRVNELPGVRQFNGDFISHFRKASDIFNASLIWRSPETRYEASFFVKNLTNELYPQAVTNVAGLLNFRVPNIRRHWGLELRMNLGDI